MTNTSSDPPMFPRLLRSLRRERSWSQKYLAEQIGVSEDSIKRWEHGRAFPNLQSQQELCKVFQMSSADLGFVKAEEGAFSKMVVVPQNPDEVTEQSQMPELNSRERREDQEESITSGEEKRPKPNRSMLQSLSVLRRSRKQTHTFRLQEQNRTRMLRKLRLTYEALLEHSLQGAIWIDLSLAEKGDVVSNAANLLLRVGDQKEHLLPSGTTILQVYDAAAQELLILGEPGAGKSTLLINLAQHLLARAEEDASLPLPVIIPLSSWAEKRQPLAVWLSEQISQVYGISRQLSEYWLNERHFLPLLDGLDEMDPAARPACIAAINTYHQEYQENLVVCSRIVEYETAMNVQRLMLQIAVVVLPLSPEQVNITLERVGEPVLALRQIMEKNATLQELAAKPLMLNLLLLAYQNVSIEQLPPQASELQQQILQDYVMRMIARKGNNKRYPSDRTYSWLGWLAREMRRRNQAVFYLEHLQPTWFPEESFRRTYERLAGKGTSLFIGLLMSLSLNAFFFGAESFANDFLFALTGGLIGWLLYSERKERFEVSAMKQALKQQWRSLVSTGIKHGLFAGALIGLVFAFWPPDSSNGGLIRGLITGGSMVACFFSLTLIIQAGKLSMLEDVSPPQRSRWAFLSFSATLRREHIELGLFTGLLLGVCIGVSAGASMGVGSALSYLFIGIFLSLILLGKDSSIELKETFDFSVSNLVQRRHLLSTFLIFLLIFLLYGLGIAFQQGLKVGLIFGFSGALSTSLLYWVYIGLWTGVSQRPVDDRNRIELNQGIRYSLRNALLIGLLASGISIFIGSFSDLLFYGLRSVLLVGFPGGLSDGLSGGLRAASRDAIFFELFGALLPFLLTGGLTWLHHYLLRWLLSRAHVAPLRYKSFLEEATRCILMYHVGGGYSFIHRTILDYFAEAPT